MISTFRLTASLLLTTLLFFPSLPASASCVQMSLSEQIADADVVATGTVTNLSQPLTGGSTITLALDAIYKGTPNNPITITSESGRTSMTSVDVIFEENANYLLLLTTSDNKNYSTNVCRGTRELGSVPLTAEEKTALGTGTPAPAASASPSDWTGVLTTGIIALVAVALGVGAIQMARKRINRG